MGMFLMMNFNNQLNIRTMKKIFLFMLPIMALSLASCEKNNGNNGELSEDDVIEFKDANFLKALLTVQEISIYDASTDDYVDYLVDVDVNKDGAITVREAQAVIGLDLIGCYISEMPEIKYFTRLEHLECGDNQLTSLDVSKNTALIYLDCFGNQLTSLAVSDNTALVELDCGENHLTSLDVSNCTALTYLMCGGNQITSLDLSNNTALTLLWCTSNQLTSLDLSNNTALTDLDCQENELTSLDLSRNIALCWFYCDDNQLTLLDLSKNTALDRLTCTSNQLTSLDVSNCTALSWLICDSNELTFLDLRNQFSEGGRLSCSGNPLESIVLSRQHNLSGDYIGYIINEYGNIITYVD